MANLLTLCRILCAAALLFVPAFSPRFYALYCLGGFTDMIDGTVARKTGAAGEFGTRFDTAADIVFVAACMVKLLPFLDIPLWLWLWIGGIGAVKAANLLWGYAVQGRLVAEHTVLNKLAGAALFALPLTIPAVDLRYSASAVCAVATLAAVWEGYRIRTRKPGP